MQNKSNAKDNNEADREGPRKNTIISKCRNCSCEYVKPACRANRDLHCSKVCIKEYAEKKRLKREVECQFCKSKFIARNTQMKDGRKPYCSISCSSKALERKPEWAEKAKITRKKNGYLAPCGPKNPRYKGGRFLTPDGYVKILIGRASYDLEHRHLMSKHLGRKLESTEIVHHINHIKTDNRLENLEILNRSTHAKLHDHDRDRNEIGQFI